MNTLATYSRREILKTVAFAAAIAPALCGLTSASGAEKKPSSATAKRSRLRLGVASFTLAKSSIDQVIAVLQQLEFETVSLYKTHAPWSDGTPEQCRIVVEKFATSGIAVTSTGMIEITDDETAARRAFENVRGAGLKMFCARQKPAALPLLDKLVKEYDLRVAIHNHGPTEDFPTGLSVWNAIQPYDRRIGLCLDIGHGFRAGENPIDTIHLARERLYELHLRDTKAPGGAMKDPHPAIVGHGAIDIRGVVAALLAIGYAGVAEFEYDLKEDDRLPGLAESVGYVRGLLAASA